MKYWRPTVKKIRTEMTKDNGRGIFQESHGKLKKIGEAKRQLD